MGEDRVDRAAGGCSNAADNCKPSHSGKRFRWVGEDRVHKTDAGRGKRKRAEWHPPKFFPDHSAHQKTTQEDFLHDGDDNHQTDRPHA